MYEPYTSHAIIATNIWFNFQWLFQSAIPSFEANQTCGFITSTTDLLYIPVDAVAAYSQECKRMTADAGHTHITFDNLENHLSMISPQGTPTNQESLIEELLTLHGGPEQGTDDLEERLEHDIGLKKLYRSIKLFVQLDLEPMKNALISGLGMPFDTINPVSAASSRKSMSTSKAVFKHRCGEVAKSMISRNTVRWSIQVSLQSIFAIKCFSCHRKPRSVSCIILPSDVACFHRHFPIWSTRPTLGLSESPSTLITMRAPNLEWPWFPRKTRNAHPIPHGTLSLLKPQMARFEQCEGSRWICPNLRYTSIHPTNALGDSKRRLVLQHTISTSIRW